jgi:lysophospholipase L1-like esterase
MSFKPFLPALTLSLVLGIALSARADDQVASFPPLTRVLFQGDSITDMNRGRSNDPNHVLGHSYAFIIGAKAASAYPERGVEFFNRGVSGDKVSDLEGRWQTDTLALKPDVLSILVGVNDLGGGVPAATFESNYDRLLSETVLSLPRIRLVLCEPFGLPTGRLKAVWARYRVDLAERQAIVARLAQKYGATLVRFQHIFDEACSRAPAETWIWDGIHPTFAGQQLLADEWVRTANAALGAPLLTPSRNSAIEPQVNFERDSYDWLHRHADILDFQAKQSPDVVMIGDSITHFWGGLPDANHSNGPQSWKHAFAGVKVMNMGFGWDRTQNVLWRLGHGELVGVHPKSIVLNIGTNNLVGDGTARTNTPEETLTGIQAIVGVVRARCPEAKIFVMAVFPRGFEKGNDLDRRISTLNRALATAFASEPAVSVLDIGPAMRQPDGSISKEVFFDGTHPTDKGYAIWAEALLKAGAIRSAGGDR